MPEPVALSRIRWTLFGLPPVSTSWAAVIGTTARSSPFWKPWPPTVLRMPTTVNGTLPTVTESPTETPRSVAVVLPRTIFCAWSVTSEALKKAPASMLRALATSHAGVLPLTVVLQLEELLTIVSRAWTTGATAWMSGALALSASPVASLMVSVLALPAPPKMPPALVLPGVMVSRLVPRAAIWELTWSDDAWPMPTVQMTAATPKRMPRVVRIERSR